MTWIVNSPSDFTKEMVEGFISANSHLVRRVSGGVIRNTKCRSRSVAIVVGGGAGHYPAFAGLVGQGLAHGAAMGNLFASPSAQQICSVARAVNNGCGILLMYGNYAGDVLHFELAAERLRAEGIACETLAVTDDICSAKEDERDKRRGVAGGLVVFKIAAAAAERGESLADVLSIARRANDNTRTVGIAFTGCTMPGADAPLFDVNEGMMGFGMGIHGEPGINEQQILPSNELAAKTTTLLLKEQPCGSQSSRVGVIVNGLGSVKYEELFVFWHNVEPYLKEAGMTVADVHVGEFVTSFNMAGLSLTLVWFDEELESLWLEPAYTPAFRYGSPIEHHPLDEQEVERFTESVTIPVGSAESLQTAKKVMVLFDALTDTVINNVEMLGKIDAVAGDGDHGIGMERGVIAAREAAKNALSAGCGAGTLLQHAADAWADKAGGTSGAIWGVILNTLGTTLGNERKPDADKIALAVRQASAGVVHFGKAKLGDKTLVDVLHPFSESLTHAISQGLSICDAWNQAAGEAEKCAQQTAYLIPKMGRARPLAERSLGTPDAGGLSMALIIRAVGNAMSMGKNDTLSREDVCL